MQAEQIPEFYTKWVPEAPGYVPAYYAAKHPKQLGKIGEKGVEYGTHSIHEAHQFDTEEECQQWCNEWQKETESRGYPNAVFNPVEHGFTEFDPTDV